MNKSDWIEKYKPHKDKAGAVMVYDILEDLEFIKTQDEKKVWTEIFDFDLDQTLLVGGIVLDKDGGIAFYLTEIPWSDSNQEIVEWDMD